MRGPVNVVMRLKNRLLVAVRDDDIESVARLLQQGLDANTQYYLDDQWVPVISIATRMCKSGIVRLLCENNCDLNFPHSRDIEPPLHIACCQKHVQLVQLLLQHGADPNAVNVRGESALNVAARYYRLGKVGPDILTLLLKWKANANLVDLFGTSPLMHVCRHGDPMLIKCFLDEGAEVLSQTDLSRMNAIHHQCLSDRKCGSALKLLLERAVLESGQQGVKNMLNRKVTAHSVTALHLAINPVASGAQPECEKMVSLLVDFGADVNAQDISGQTCLFKACSTNQFEVVRVLLRSGCIPWLPDVSGTPPLVEAARVGSHAIVNLLEKAGGLPDCRTLERVQQPEVRRELVQRSKEPSALQDIARRAILRSLATTINEAIMPKLFVSFLNFHDCPKNSVSCQ